jgi:hypothetical protein
VRTEFELMVEVAEHLARKPVRLRFKHNKGYKGLCRADSSGVPVIDLEPSLQWNEEEFLRVFLHEVSHALNHSFIPMELEVSDKVQPVQGAGYILKEFQADTEAEAWLRFAEKNRDREKYYYFVGCLLSLLDY